jgi:hypothetical protein
MASFKDLLERTSPREPIGYVPLVIVEEDRSQFSPDPGKCRVIGMDDENFVLPDGSGLIFFDCPVYAMSSAQKKAWDSAAQRISAIFMENSNDETVAMMLSGGAEKDLSIRSQMGLFTVGADQATFIRSNQEDMVRTALSLSHVQLDLITSIRGLGNLDDDLFSIILDGLRKIFEPKKAPEPPKDGTDDDEGKGKGKTRKLNPSA